MHVKTVFTTATCTWLALIACAAENFIDRFL